MISGTPQGDEIGDWESCDGACTGCDVRGEEVSGEEEDLRCVFAEGIASLSTVLWTIPILSTAFKENGRRSLGTNVSETDGSTGEEEGIVEEEEKDKEENVFFCGESSSSFLVIFPLFNSISKLDPNDLIRAGSDFLLIITACDAINRFASSSSSSS
jgi:hypothetical protein